MKAVANKVKENGKGLEDILRQKEKDNPKFDFLFKEEVGECQDRADGSSPNTIFTTRSWIRSIDFRHRLLTRSRMKWVGRVPFLIHQGYASLYSSDSAEDSEKERTGKGKMGRLARKRFEAMLRVMSGKRGEIARAMEFALTRAEAADEVGDDNASADTDRRGRVSELTTGCHACTEKAGETAPGFRYPAQFCEYRMNRLIAGVAITECLEVSTSF